MTSSAAVSLAEQLMTSQDKPMDCVWDRGRPSFDFGASAYAQGER
jgi:hypothetical protein